MRRDNHEVAAAMADDNGTYFTYRPLSNLPTPPPTYKESKSPSTIASSSLEDGEPLKAKYRGPAIHLVNLIPSSASLAIASVPIVQAILSRADLPIETVALAVCILDSLDKKFARAWRLSCPLLPGTWATSSTNKRHTLPPTPLLYQHQQHQMLHIDSVPPELIILAALVIAVKFIEDPQQPTQYYCDAWGRGTWSHDQLNATERCIMESLNYRIMPLCDEDCLSDAMVDMQLAGRQLDWDTPPLSPPDSLASSSSNIDRNFVLGHCRSKTMMPSTAALGLGLSLTPSESPCTTSCEAVTTPRSETLGTTYF
ncbi:cyclin domain protein [Metarhizium robertsii]|uniref:Cyclin-like protein n=2 Tax=Metarhizium robertsii TaxID=568076 RepID=E9EYJ2_METRA|nr:Cyclin-like protein [Metarhizium robertsii ARSEF 23]EFY99033.1 Cyclin-like protein [Metarhizium robertsii ARSEF 23]EXV04965.1 cyclin domain protein [Metarhizium robertsii]